MFKGWERFCERRGKSLAQKHSEVQHPLTKYKYEIGCSLWRGTLRNYMIVVIVCVKGGVDVEGVEGMSICRHDC